MNVLSMLLEINVQAFGLISPKLRIVIMFSKWIFKKLFGGKTMIRLMFFSVFVGMLSSVTGIPLSPYYPIVQNNKIRFELTSINQKKYSNFKHYVGSRL